MPDLNFWKFDAIEDNLSRRNRALLALADVEHANWRRVMCRSLALATYTAILFEEAAEERLTAAVLRQQAAGLRRTSQQTLVVGRLRSRPASATAGR